ncbi:MAG: hypothetical protein P1V13_11485 [Rhizobiaceae bacterium]|nr:hypothetical protein [Rhizobiaceae bacterium]
MKKPLFQNTNVMTGLFFTALALLLLFVWIPLDSDTGLIEKVRRQVAIGDALAPTVAALFLLIGGGLLMLLEGKSDTPPAIDAASVKFVARIFAMLVLSFVLMRYAGPLAVQVVNAIQGNDLEYRLLRDTAPWKWLGYVLGGTLAICGTISLTEGRFSLRALVVALLAIAAMIAIFDLPFDDLLLPPNGDL